MRILIISSVRCGGNTFLYWISNELSLKYICEPYNENTYKIFPDIYSDNIVVKMPYQHFQIIDEVVDIDNFVCNFINKFDYTIALTRRDIRAASESLIAANISKNFLNEYIVDDKFIKSHESEISRCCKEYENINEKIKNLDVLQVEYENIFINKIDIYKIKEYLNIDKFNYLNMLDYNRYRKFSENNKFRLI